MSPKAVLKRARAQLPDVLVALQQVPQIFQTAVRDATEGRLRLTVENPGVAELRDEIRRSASRRDTAIAAAVLWLSGLAWLTLSTQIAWLGWLQMAAAIVIFVVSRPAGARGK
jgi:hypothetical protein